MASHLLNRLIDMYFMTWIKQFPLILSIVIELIEKTHAADHTWRK